LYVIYFLSYNAKRLVGALVAWNYDRVSRRIEASSTATVRRALVAHLPPRAVVLKIGAGTGATLASGAYESSPNAPQRVVLVEPDCNMRGRMEKKLNDGGLDQRVTAELTVVCAALPNLSFSDAYLDAVVTCFVTSHLPRRLESMKEVFRVLRPGGVLAVLDHGAHADGHDHHRRSDCRREKQDHGTHSDGHGHHPPSDDHRTKQNCSSEEKKDSALSWFWELTALNGRCVLTTICTAVLAYTLLRLSTISPRRGLKRTF
jgi:ubiquinone/menaquinone biosynthesis C-methylase UbiE